MKKKKQFLLNYVVKWRRQKSYIRVQRKKKVQTRRDKFSTCEIQKRQTKQRINIHNWRPKLLQHPPRICICPTHTYWWNNSRGHIEQEDSQSLISTYSLFIVLYIRYHQLLVLYCRHTLHVAGVAKIAVVLLLLLFHSSFVQKKSNFDCY